MPVFWLAGQRLLVTGTILFSGEGFLQHVGVSEEISCGCGQLAMQGTPEQAEVFALKRVN